jgi:hypothetical protein
MRRTLVIALMAAAVLSLSTPAGAVQYRLDFSADVWMGTVAWTDLTQSLGTGIDWQLLQEIYSGAIPDPAMDYLNAHGSFDSLEGTVSYSDPYGIPDNGVLAFTVAGSSVGLGLDLAFALDDLLLPPAADLLVFGGGQAVYDPDHLSGCGALLAFLDIGAPPDGLSGGGLPSTFDYAAWDYGVFAFARVEVLGSEGTVDLVVGKVTDATLSAVPEPSTLMLLSLGVMAASLATRFRRRPRPDARSLTLSGAGAHRFRV